MKATLRAKMALPRLWGHIRIPLYRNAYALILNEGASAVLGLLYWVVAVRLYSPQNVGTGALAIGALVFLANVAQFNLRSAILHFFPAMGAAAGRLVVAAYAITGGAAVVCGLIFVFGRDIWLSGANGAFLLSGADMAMFVAAIVAWSLFALQDGVLTALRKAVYIPAENMVFNLLKIGLMIGLAGIAPRTGLLVSWIIPSALLIVPVNWLIFRRLLPHYLQTLDGGRSVPQPRQIAQYTAANYVGQMLGQIAVSLLPFIVVNRIGVVDNAYYFQAWTIAYLLQAVASYMATSFTVEASVDLDRTAEYLRKTFTHMLRIIVPAAILIAIGAPLIMSVFGPGYAQHGSGALSWFALSAIPNIVNALFLAWARVRRHIRLIMLTQLLLCGVALSLSYVLAPVLGLSGIGVAWMAAQVGLALVCVMLFRRHERLPAAA
jgi:O-antigen/teichoic acid export membrane protein